MLPSRAEEYRNQAKCIRENAAKVSSAYIRQDMETTARRYEQLAEGLEQAERRH
jgi:hypothetical protein